MINIFKKKYIQIEDAVFKTYKTYKIGTKEESNTTYVYTILIDNVLRKFQVSKIETFKNCIIYYIEFLR